MIEMHDVIATLLKQQTTIFEILEFDERPEPRPPATTAQLATLTAWCRNRGFELPPSYAEFLTCCDGIDNFSVSFSLFGSIDLLSDTYPMLLTEALEAGVGFAYPEELPPVLIGHDSETTTRVWFELSHEVEDLDEPIVLDGDPGDLTLHSSFGAFLRSRISVNEETIRRLLELRAESAPEQR